MKRQISALLACGCVTISLHVFAQPKTFQYRFNLVDAATGNAISPETVQIEVDGEEQMVMREGRIASISLSVPLDRRVKISARPEGEYIPRTVVLTPDGIATGRVKALAIERRPVRFNLPYLLSGAQRFERGEIDAGFALFEAAALSGSHRPQLEEVSDYDVLLRWNYARGLQQACLVLGYDTCNTAAERLAIVDSDFENEVNARRYRARRVTHEMVKRAQLDLSAKDTKAQYERGLRAFREKQHDAAIAVWEGLLNKPELLGAVQLTKDKLESDISFAKTRKAEASARDPQ